MKWEDNRENCIMTRLEEHAARIGEKRNSYTNRILVENQNEGDHSEGKDVVGGIILKRFLE
jgi:hypothetical protein